ncbi:MAG: 30S ribosomal protein S6 [Oscillospiraceae bacterium]
MAEIMNSYETVIVISAKLGEEGNTALIEKFKKLIEENGAIESVDDWGKRRFAYPIEKQTDGFYTLINFKSAADFTAELDRRYQITDGILRTLIIKKDPRLLRPKKPLKAAKPIDVEAVAAEAVIANEAKGE